MPKLYLPVTEVELSVTRPVLLDIIRQVKEITRIPQDTKEVFLGDARSAIQPGSTLDTPILSNTNIAASNQLTLEVAETYNELLHGALAIAQPEHRPIFIDDEVGITIKPIYTSRTYEINVRYRHTSRTQAKAWRDEIYMHVQHLRDINLHSADYHYSIPAPMLALLKEIHRLREDIEPYHQSFEEYYTSHSSYRHTELTTLEGSKSLYTVSERQIRIQGMFTFTDAPEKEQMGGDTNLWISEFTYKVTFDVPTGMHISYPVMVHNQMLDDKYIPERIDDPDEHTLAYSRSFKSLSYFEAAKQSQNRSSYPQLIHIPECDDWYPDNYPLDYQPILSALCQVDTDQPHLLLNLKELGDYHIDDEILEYFEKVEYPYLTLPTMSPYHLSYHRFKFLQTDQKTKLDHELNFTHQEPLSLRDNHRISLLLAGDIQSVDVNAWKRMKRYPNVLRKTLYAMSVNYTDLAYLAPRIDLTAYMPELQTMGVHKHDAFMRTTGVMRTVNRFYVVARNGLSTAKIVDYKQIKALYSQYPAYGQLRR